MSKIFLSPEELINKHEAPYPCWREEDILAWYYDFQIDGIEKQGKILIDESSFTKLLAKLKTRK
ncbi:hypothetical protein JMN32_15130 [Fulvivirga sp. 29W222]|uniref:Uncharacterized protein n=1 Tax=Fulvivirga marina TaxID=2494733 RepID=A0A937KCQ6_9BACT|nr:hypothetical protein [Fulvivirga marina]MBL6447649.1 hypothetical protein [Fulvivirga marina]